MVIYSNVIVNKSFDFALEIINIYKALVFNKEFILYKMNIALKEANESEYWLELIIQSKILEDANISKALQDCKEICKILSKIAGSCRNET